MRNLIKMRIYGKAINAWKAVDERGIESQVERRFIYAWDGQKRNKGNKRWFMCMCFVEFRKDDKRALKEYYKEKYQATEIQFR